MPTLPDYPGVFTIQLKSHSLPYGWPNTPEFAEKCSKYVFSHSFWPIFSKKIQKIWRIFAAFTPILVVEIQKSFSWCEIGSLPDFNFFKVGISVLVRKL